MTFITLNLQYTDVQGDSMYSNLLVDATCFFNITLRLHIPGIMSNFIDCLSHVYRSPLEKVVFEKTCASQILL